MANKWKKISVTFEMDRPFTDYERAKLMDAIVEMARDTMDKLDKGQGNLIRWTAFNIPDWYNKA